MFLPLLPMWQDTAADHVGARSARRGEMSFLPLISSSLLPFRQLSPAASLTARWTPHVRFVFHLRCLPRSSPRPPAPPRPRAPAARPRTPPGSPEAKAICPGGGAPCSHPCRGRAVARRAGEPWRPPCVGTRWRATGRSRLPPVEAEHAARGPAKQAIPFSLLPDGCAGTCARGRARRSSPRGRGQARRRR